MAKFEIHKRFGNLWDWVWWKYMPGSIIDVRWPSSRWHALDELGNESLSSDPNDHYRPELEQLVGSQGWDWNWRIGGFDKNGDRLHIKIRRAKQQWATYFLMKWN